MPFTSSLPTLSTSLSVPADSPEPANQPLRFKRDPETGLVEGLTYRYTPEGLIDWRAMVDRRFLYVAREHEAKVVAAQGKSLAEIDILLVKDDWLRIRVGGLNQLAHLRGVVSCVYPHMLAREGWAATTCEITFIANVESGGYPETWSGQASACRTSMDTRMLPYLETFAENRAFSRAVKRALQINILSDIEVGGDSRDAAAGGDDGTKEADLANAPTASGFKPCDELVKVCQAHRVNGAAAPVSFEMLKAAAIKLNADTAPEAKERVQADPSTWKAFSDIQPIDAWLLIGKIKEKEAAGEGPAKKAKPLKTS